MTTTDDLIPEGTYKARSGRTGVLGYTSKGNEQLGIAITLLDGPGAGRSLTWYGYFSDATFDRTVESLRTMGWGGADIADLEGLGSTEFFAVIKHEPDLDGVLRARVAFINGSEGVAMKDRMDAGAARAFANRIRGAIMAHGAGVRNARPPAATPGQRPTGGTPRPAANAAPAPADDDIPF